MSSIAAVTEIVGAIAVTATSTTAVVKFIESRRRRVTVQLKHGWPTYTDSLGENYLGRDVLLVEAMNPGSLPVTLTSFGIILPNGSTLVSRWPDGSVDLPHELAPGKNCLKWLEMIPAAESLVRAGYSGKVKLVGFYRDALDRRHKSRPLEIDVEMWLRIAAKSR